MGWFRFVHGDDDNQRPLRGAYDVQVSPRLGPAPHETTCAAAMFGRVQVIATASTTALELIVRDQGPGIPEGMREQVFEAFFSTKEKSMKTSGMGLGLALVRRTVAAAGGTIRIETAAGGGTEFIVTLPLHGTGRGAGA